MINYFSNLAFSRMSSSIEGLQATMAQAAHYLLTPSKSFYKPKLQESHFDLDDARKSAFSLPEKFLIQIESPEDAHRVVLINSHARRRSEVVTFRVTDANVRVYRVNTVEGDDEEEAVPCQISPVFDDQVRGGGEGGDQGAGGGGGQGLQILNTEFELSFLAQVKGLALQTYYIKMMRPEEGVNS